MKLESAAHRVLATLMLGCGAVHAYAAWPERPIRFIVPFPPGGGADIMARPMTALLGKHLGQQVVVDNRGGAGGTVAAPDGYTLFFGTVGTHAIHVSLYGKLPYDPVKDFAPISLTHNAPRVLVVHASLPVKSVSALIALAKSKPGQLSFASAGNGGTNHLSGELFKVIDRLNADLSKVMADGEIRRQLVEQGVEPMHTTPDELAALMRRDTEKWSKIVKASGAKLD